MNWLGKNVVRWIFQKNAVGELTPIQSACSQVRIGKKKSRFLLKALVPKVSKLFITAC